jgi:hypothetical protein
MFNVSVCGTATIAANADFKSKKDAINAANLMMATCNSISRPFNNKQMTRTTKKLQWSNSDYTIHVTILRR